MIYMFGVKINFGRCQFLIQLNLIKYINTFSLLVHDRDCFVSTDDNQTVRSFVRAASNSKSHPHLQWAKIADKLWSLYMLNMSKEYQRNPNRLQKTLVSRVGRQPNSNTWVLSPDVQVDHHGQLIPKRHQKFYW